MPPIVISQSPQITVLYHPEGRIIHHEVHANLRGTEYRDALTAGMEAMKKYGAKKWLSDDRKNAVFSPDDLTWSRDVWGPEVIKAGWKYWAIVMPARPLARIRMEEGAEVMPTVGVTTKIFDDPTEAMKWLRSQQTTD
jgi:hypothetical protein